MEVIEINIVKQNKKTVQILYDDWKKIKQEAFDTDTSISEVIEKLVEYYGL